MPSRSACVGRELVPDIDERGPLLRVLVPAALDERLELVGHPADVQVGPLPCEHPTWRSKDRLASNGPVPDCRAWIPCRLTSE